MNIGDAQSEFNRVIKLGNVNTQYMDAYRVPLDLYNFALSKGFQPSTDPNHLMLSEVESWLKKQNLYDQARAQAGMVNYAKSIGYTGGDYFGAYAFENAYKDAYQVAQQAGLPVQQGMSYSQLEQLAQQNQSQFNATAMSGNITGGNSGTGTVPSGGTSGGTTGGTSGGTTPDLSSLPPELQQLYTQLETYLKELEKRGQVLNPNIEITPQKMAEFLKQAETEIAPYYANLLKTSRDSLYQTLGFTRDQVLINEQRLEQQYGKNLRGLGETSAEQGFALSGLRQRDEGELATDTQQVIDDSRRQ